jgi:hypothetical protein
MRFNTTLLSKRYSDPWVEIMTNSFGVYASEVKVDKANLREVECSYFVIN